MQSDPCIFALRREDTYYIGVYVDDTYIGVYVDDMVLAEKGTAKMRSVKEELSSMFDIMDLVGQSYFLEMFIVQRQEEKKTWIGQPTYADKLLTKMGMNDSKLVKSPVDPGNHLMKAAEEGELRAGPTVVPVTNRQSDVATCTSPDTAYAVGMLARFSSNPNQTHWTATK